MFKRIELVLLELSIAASGDKQCPKFRDRRMIPSSRVEMSKCLALEDEATALVSTFRAPSYADVAPHIAMNVKSTASL